MYNKNRALKYGGISWKLLLDVSVSRVWLSCLTALGNSNGLSQTDCPESGWTYMKHLATPWGRDETGQSRYRQRQVQAQVLGEISDVEAGRLRNGKTKVLIPARSVESSTCRTFQAGELHVISRSRRTQSSTCRTFQVGELHVISRSRKTVDENGMTKQPHVTGRKATENRAKASE